MLVKRSKIIWNEVFQRQVRNLSLTGRQRMAVLRKYWQNPITRELELRNVFYKFSADYDEERGYEALNEVVVSRLLTELGISHVEYTLGLIEMHNADKVERVPCCISYDYKGAGQTAMPLDLYCALQGKHNPEQTLQELDMQTELNRMYLVDFLIRNIRRTQRDVELYNLPDGRLVMAPLFDNGSSLVVNPAMLRSIQSGELNPLDDNIVTGITGKVSLFENMKKIMQPVKVHALTHEGMARITYGLKAVLERPHMDALLELLKVRYDYARQEGILVEE